jgi:hypothetical protein
MIHREEHGVVNAVFHNALRITVVKINSINMKQGILLQVSINFQATKYTKKVSC